ncbi:MAG: TPM domain-containing protein [Bacilli bacterium]|nr:TPM domain-containing protein [Bacilli bacterium]MBR1817745.1 TPM domain-containing protein [Bacilli bacterium]
MNKKILLVFLCLLCLFSLFTTAHALEYNNTNTNYKALIDDQADLLTTSEEQQLLDEIIPLTEFGHIVFHSTDKNSSNITTYANNYYYSNYQNQSGTIFIIDMSTRKIYIVSSGANYKIITKSKSEIITDNIYTYASRKEYYECASKAFEQISTLLNNGKIAEPMRYISNGVIALTLAFLVNFIFVYFYSKLKKASIADIISKSISTITVGNVSATKTGQDRVYSPIETSSSSGGGSSGGGGGGGFSGGGGGHSF